MGGDRWERKRKHVALAGRKELNSENLKTCATPNPLGPESRPNPPFFPVDHRLSKYFQMSLGAIQGPASTAWTI